jgi:uncharacterized protein (DUF433 family)
MGTLLRFPADAHRVRTATGFYTPAEAARIARVPRHRLDAWRREGIVRPTIEMIEDGRESKGYTFDALVYLRVIRMLRDERDVPLERSVEALQHIVARFGPPGPAWADARVFLATGHAFVHGDDEWQTTVATMHGQRVVDEFFGQEFLELRDRDDALLVPKKFRTVVEVNPAVQSGLPVVMGTKIKTSVLYDMRHQRPTGTTPSEIRMHYPVLTTLQIKTALAYESFLDAEAL